MTSAKWIARAFALFLLAVTALGIHAARVTTTGGTVAASSLLMSLRN